MVHYNPVGAKGHEDLMQVSVQIEGLNIIGLMDGGSTSSLGGQTLYHELRELGIPMQVFLSHSSG